MTGRRSTIYCFHCGDELTFGHGEPFCARGSMGLSKKMLELVEEVVAAKPARTAVSLVIESKLRCVRCRGVMMRTDKTNTLVCQDCCAQYSSSMVYQMIELHPHEKFLNPGEPLTRSVIAFANHDLTPEHFAKHLQSYARMPAKRAWELTEKIQNSGSALIFTGHPRDCEIVVGALKSARISTALKEN